MFIASMRAVRATGNVSAVAVSLSKTSGSISSRQRVNRCDGVATRSHPTLGLTTSSAMRAFAPDLFTD